METDTVVANLKAYFAARPERIACAYLYGSVARGTAHADSDVDVAVLLEKEPPPTLEASAVALAGDLEAALTVPVDAVFLNAAPVDLIHRVLRDGILVFERDRAQRVRFEVRVRNEYFDLEPYQKEYRRASPTRNG